MKIVRRVRSALASWVAYRNTVRELSELDTRALRDLGISRSDIRDVARSASIF